MKVDIDGVDIKIRPEPKRMKPKPFKHARLLDLVRTYILFHKEAPDFFICRNISALLAAKEQDVGVCLGELAKQGLLLGPSYMTKQYASECGVIHIFDGLRWPYMKPNDWKSIPIEWNGQNWVKYSPVPDPGEVKRVLKEGQNFRIRYGQQEGNKFSERELSVLQRKGKYVSTKGQSTLSKRDKERLGWKPEVFGWDAKVYFTLRDSKAWKNYVTGTDPHIIICLKCNRQYNSDQKYNHAYMCKIYRTEDILNG